ncbi:MAG: hypothetical protein IPG32_14275 [Saprospirales bacterium]|nr:hypothetical protein [Saprospirales bacterium]
MDPASSIEVNPNVKLTIKSQSVLHGCEYMWRGINLPGQARLEIDSSTVRDAHYAVRALHFSRIKLTASTFDANYIGVYIPPPTPPNVQNIVFRLNGSPNDIKDNYFGFLSAYLSPYSGQSPHPGSFRPMPGFS